VEHRTIVSRAFERYWAEHRKDGRAIYRQLGRNRAYYRLLEKWLKSLGLSRPRILEIGCGTAIDSYHLSELIEVDTFGMDLSLEALHEANRLRRYFQRPIHLHCAEAEFLPYADACFDAVFSSGVMEHFDNLEKVFLEHRRVLRDDGILAIHVPHKYSLFALYANVRMKLGNWPWGWETQFSATELRELGPRLGLDVLEIQVCNSVVIELVRWLNTEALPCQPERILGPLPGVYGVVDTFISRVDAQAEELLFLHALRQYAGMMIVGIFRKRSSDSAFFSKPTQPGSE